MNEVRQDNEGRISTETRGHVFLIGIDRPKKLNGFTLKMLRELAAAFSTFEAAADARAALIFAHGATEGVRAFIERRKANFTGK